LDKEEAKIWKELRQLIERIAARDPPRRAQTISEIADMMSNGDLKKKIRELLPRDLGK
jgi:hypothetical protein